MSDGRPTWETARSAQRKRAALALGAIALVAVLVVAAMLLFVNDSSSGNGNGTDTQVAGPTDSGTTAPTTQPRSSVQTSPTGATSSTRATPSKQPTPKPTRVTCSTEPACTLPGDPGNTLAAVNAYRTSHGQLAIPGSVSRAAQTCAVHNGDSPPCPKSYFWEPVSGHNGNEVISKIAAKRDGAQFLLDPSVKSVHIGWAYIPSSGSYECAVVNVY